MRAEDLIRSLAARVKDLGGWRRRGAAFAAGSLSVLAMAPFFAWPILWITLPVLVWLIDGAVADGGTRWWRQPAVRAAEIGWWFGVGYFLFGLFWFQFLLGGIVPEALHGVERIAVGILYLILGVGVLLRERGQLRGLFKDGLTASYDELSAGDGATPG